MMMSGTIPFTRQDAELCVEMSLSFHRFLIQMKFKGDYETAMYLQRETEKDPVISTQDLSIVHLFQAWKLCFKSDISTLWLTSSVQDKSPIPAITGIVYRLGVPGAGILTHDSRSLRFHNGNQINVSSYYPNAGCGMSLTELVMEDCPSIAMYEEMKANLCPVLYGVTKGKGRIITISD